MARIFLSWSLWTGAVLLYVGLHWPPVAEWRPRESGWITDRAGRPMAEMLAPEAVRSGWISGARFPDALIGAVVVAEDRRFHAHPGVDPVALARALLQDVRAGRIVSGGSTITQQLARMLWPRPRTLAGKALEALRALQLERELTKGEILEQYLNRAPFGNQLYGIEAAARVYLDKSVESLTPAESAFLAALPRAPGWLNPYRRREAIERRQRQILRKMAAGGYLDAAELAAALRERIRLRDTRGLLKAPHFVREVLGEAKDLRAGAALVTTLDLSLQAAAEAILRQTLSSLKARGVNNGAVVVLDTRTREVLAWVGSREFHDEEEGGQNDGVLALRQPGSALKPFTYLTALEGRYTASSLLADVPTNFATGHGPYTPSNYDNRFHGPVRLRLALASSLNIPAVQVAEAVGPTAILGTLRDLGFESLDRPAEYYGLALTLGGGEVRLLELANAYASLAERGVHRPVRLQRDSPRAPGRQAVDAAAAAMILDILGDDKARALTFGEGSLLELPFPVAVKTGTSKNFRDNWCVGATTEVTVAVWVGNFTGEPMAQVSGITGAGPVWRQVMQVAMEGRPRKSLTAGAGLLEAEICPVSGDAPSEACPTRISERFLPGKLPRRVCTMHQMLRVTADGRLLANPRCPRPGDHARSFEVLPERFSDWSRQVNRPMPPDRTAVCESEEVAPVPGTASGTPVKALASRIQILSPVPGGLYALDPGIPAVFQKLRMRVLAPPDRSLEWLLNGDVLAQDHGSFDWPIQRGNFRLEVRTTDQGEPLTAAREFLVK